MVTPARSPRRARTTALATALSATVAGGVACSAFLSGASADVLAQPASAEPASQPQVVLVQRVERPVVIRAEESSQLDEKGNDLFEISSLGSFDVPEAAIRAYKNAAKATNASHPGCELPWTLLAAIGRVESDHGRYGGSVLGSDGVPRPAIRGVALNGVGPVAAIPDSDGGTFDGDTVWDRAVGPMQFIPTTWAGSGRDGDGDGVADPNDIDDAALAAAGYLCPSSGSILAPGAMEQAIFSYNHSDYYVSLVRAFEQGYRTGTFTIPSPPPPAEDEEPQEEEKRKKKRSGDKPVKETPDNGDDSGDKRDKPRRDEPKQDDGHKHKGGGKGSGKGSGTGSGTGSGGKSTPKPPADKTVTGVLALAGTTWKVGNQSVDFGDLTATSLVDWDGDGQLETRGAELEGLAGQEVTVVLPAGTTAVSTLLDQLWG